MKKLVIILMAVLVLLGGGGAAWWFFLKEEEKPVAEEPPPPDPIPVPLFVDFDPLVVAVFRDGQVTQHLTFSIIVEVPTVDDKATVYAYRRRLIDAYYHQLHTLLSRRYVQQQADPVPLLRKRLFQETERVVGKGVVGNLLLSVLDSRNLPTS